MGSSWPPTAHERRNYSQSSKYITSCTQSVNRRQGVRPCLGANGETRDRLCECIAAGFPVTKRRAYLFRPVTTSPPLSLVGVMMPSALRDSISHAITIRALPVTVPNAKDYLQLVL